MQFIRAEGWHPAVEAVAGRLIKELSGSQRVLWLVSGGSQTTANVDIMKKIPADLSARLTVMPADERYGDVGHADSNWAKLTAAGFDPKQASTMPVLRDGLDFDDTAKRFNEIAMREFGAADFILGQLGLGADGHTAGILPGSAACAENEALAAHYDAPPLRRLTLTFPALRRVSAAYLLAFGPDKKAALERLRSPASLTEQPAQILKEIREAYVYNDQVGE